MVFYGDGVVWDVSLQKELCKFERRWTEDGKRLPGIYETDDPVVIMKLEAAGYTGEGERPKPIEQPKPEVKKEEKKPEPKKEEKPKKVEFPVNPDFGVNK